MAISEGVATRVTYKFYSTGDMDSASLPSIATDPGGASGGQILRRTSMGVNLSKTSFQSSENRVDRQTADMRYGRKLAQGPLNGELSAGTWSDLFAAVLRNNWVKLTPILPAAITSVAADAASNSLILAGGDPVALGLRIGSIITLTGMTDATLNNKTLLILGFSGSNNRTIRVYPAVTTSAAATAATIVSPGGRCFVPSASFTKKKMALEVFDADGDYARLFTELRLHGFNMSMPPEGMVTLGFNATGRDMVELSGATAPYFVNPTVQSPTPVLASASGLLQVGGTTVGLVTGLELTADVPVEANPAAFQKFVPDILLGRFALSGNMTAYFQTNSLYTYFLNEQLPSFLAFLAGPEDQQDNAIAMYMPRIMITEPNIQTEGEGGVMVSMGFTALKPTSNAIGVEQTTFQIYDTKVP